LRDELGHIQVQKLSKADLDDLVGRMWRGEVKGRDNTPRQGARDDVKHRKRLTRLSTVGRAGLEPATNGL
jgi:hypothetical protein